MEIVRVMASAARRLRGGDTRDTLDHAKLIAARWLDVPGADFPLAVRDIADSHSRRPPCPPAVAGGRKLRVGWVIVPPSLGSGGHTTLFRMVAATERAGHTSVIYLYDRHHGSLKQQARTIRKGWPTLRSEIQPLPKVDPHVDLFVATGWTTAHALASRPQLGGRRVYFVQDYEPFFYPRGYEYSLAEDTYRFGFRTIALGHMVASRLATEIGICPDIVEFSCDTTVYRNAKGTAREGIVFYARPGADRRGYQLAVQALTEFHRRRPRVPIHTYGAEPRSLPFATIRHGRMPPHALNRLYGSVAAGLALSFTNISLVAEEMLAAGVIPVVNESAEARADLRNPYVKWTRATPTAVAAALEEIACEPLAGERANEASKSVRMDDWKVTCNVVVQILEDEARTGTPSGTHVPHNG